MKPSTLISALIPALPLALLSSMSMAQTLDVKITNLTQGMIFTPLLVSAHTDSSNLFMAGAEATDALQAMAEGGNIAPLIAASSETVVNEQPGGLAPAMSTMVSNMDTGTNDLLSIVAMVLPTNDGFVGLDSWAIPSEAGTYTVYLNAYDAGTEVNDEIINGAGAPGELGIPGGHDATGATGVTDSEANTSIHIHRGNIGDTNDTAGISDVDSRIHRWLNPVAKVVVTVK